MHATARVVLTGFLGRPFGTFFVFSLFGGFKRIIFRRIVQRALNPRFRAAPPAPLFGGFKVSLEGFWALG